MATSNGKRSKTTDRDPMKTASCVNAPGAANRSAEHLEQLTRSTAKGPRAIEVPPLDIREMTLVLVGTSPLICHAWSTKAMGKIRDKQTQAATKGRDAKIPEEDFAHSLYPMPGKPGRYGFPTRAFKSAAVSACTSLGKAISKVAARQAFHINGELAEIHGPAPIMREDMVNVGSGGTKTADLRYRGEFVDWWVRLTLVYNARVLSAEQIINLFNVAGFAVGVGEWRVEKNGNHGRFRISTGDDAKRLGIT